MERFKNISSWPGEFRYIPREANNKINDGSLSIAEAEMLPHTKTAEITVKQRITEIFGQSGTAVNLAEGEDNEGSSGADDSNWQNNEDPEAAENSDESVGTGTTHGDTSTDKDLATDEKIGGNEAAGAGSAGGTGGGGTSGGGIGGTTTSSGTGVSGVPAGTGTANS